MTATLFGELALSECKSALVLVNEELGTSCDFVVSEFFKGFGGGSVLSFGKPKDAYRTVAAPGETEVFSMVDRPYRQKAQGERLREILEVVRTARALLVVDDWNTRVGFVQGLALADLRHRGSTLVVNRSVTDRCYADMYAADLVVEVKSLRRGRPLRFDGTLEIRNRRTGLQVELFYKAGEPVEYFQAEGR